MFSCQKVFHKVLRHPDLLHDADNVQIVFKPVFRLSEFCVKLIFLAKVAKLKNLKKNFQVVSAAFAVGVNKCLSAAENSKDKVLNILLFNFSFIKVNY